MERGGDKLKKLFLLGFVFLLSLTACSKEKVIPGPKEEGDTRFEEHVELERNPKEQKVEKLMADSSTFHFVADWISDSELIYVVKKNGMYSINKYDIYNGMTTELFQETSLVIDVQVHPKKEYILIHTSDHPSYANIQIRSITGELVDTVEIESNEISIEWNDLNPSLLLLTAFQEDWSYDVFLYSGEIDEIQLLPFDNPFPKWFGEDQIVIGLLDDHPLDGSKLQLVDVNQNRKKWLIEDSVVYFDTFQDSLLTMTIDEQRQEAIFTIFNDGGEKVFDWKAPAVSNYSEWAIPEMDWIESTTLFMISPKSAGLMDEMNDEAQLTMIDRLGLTMITKVPYGAPISCSSTKCLLGYRADIIVDIETGEQEQWLELR